ncbi:hypothetical protein [Nocardia sp. IFM 10818]
MVTPKKSFSVPPQLPDFLPGPRDVSSIVAAAVRGILGRLSAEVADVEASRGPDGGWSAVVRLGRRLIDDGRGGMAEPSDLVAAAAEDGRLAEALGTGPVEIADAGPTATLSVTVPGHLAAAVREAVLAAVPEADVSSPRRSNARTVTISMPGAPKKPSALPG